MSTLERMVKSLVKAVKRNTKERVKVKESTAAEGEHWRHMSVEDVGLTALHFLPEPGTVHPSAPDMVATGQFKGSVDQMGRASFQINYQRVAQDDLNP